LLRGQPSARTAQETPFLACCLEKAGCCDPQVLLWANMPQYVISCVRRAGLKTESYSIAESKSVKLSDKFSRSAKINVIHVVDTIYFSLENIKNKLIITMTLSRIKFF
jgi:hypothetical protein